MKCMVSSLGKSMASDGSAWLQGDWVERGVRFVEMVDGSSSHNWDQHSDMSEHAKHAKNIDQPIAGLLKDLKQRGMLDEDPGSLDNRGW